MCGFFVPAKDFRAKHSRSHYKNGKVEVAIPLKLGTLPLKNHIQFMAFVKNFISALTIKV